MVSTSAKNTTFIKCLRREATDYTPVWLMRQAGRYQPEYREIRSRVGFLELCKNPELASEVTVRAVEQLGVDAGIIFADILLPLEPLNLGLKFAKGDGPVIENPIRTLQDIEALPQFDPEESLSFVLDAIKKTTKELSVPLIGFAGAPFTLASYAVEGGSSRHYERTKTLMYREPDAWHKLMETLSTMTVRYLESQIKAGADVVQIFDSWVGSLSPADYKKYVLPHMQSLIDRVKGQAPVIYFGTMTGGILDLMSESGADVIGVDWRIDLDRAWDLIGANRGVQGNLDPLVLMADKDEIERQAKNVLKQANGKLGHIFNLGHGVLPETPPENAKYLVDLVHELSSK